MTALSRSGLIGFVVLAFWVTAACGSSNDRATADGTAGVIANAMTDGDNPALIALTCPRTPDKPAAPDELVSGETPVTVGSVDQKGQAAMAVLNDQRNAQRSYGALLVQGDDGNWCLFGFRNCPRDVKVTSVNFVTVCRG
ncbi:hypothetical protein DL990_27810 [Amycolatopsis sp. WAC 01416]|uniref:hypothetical protein n=1 Tax=Amycolatopsis sp. WAC 01416 TaxID=2203196 RepID=UPI000F768D83|nr:hypothetical protein [Amycolatopsis sp. WAC 01416]RSN28468.1 hypothetical protein DL990_27810 [Amycolatopsis sp. WAC 01416]